MSVASAMCQTQTTKARFASAASDRSTAIEFIERCFAAGTTEIEDSILNDSDVFENQAGDSILNIFARIVFMALYRFVHVCGTFYAVCDNTLIAEEKFAAIRTWKLEQNI